jgi:hypothetical protein
VQFQAPHQHLCEMVREPETNRLSNAQNTDIVINHLITIFSLKDTIRKTAVNTPKKWCVVMPSDPDSTCCSWLCDIG